MTSIRTVAITMSPLFRDLVTELIAAHCNVDLVAELDSREAIEQRLQAVAPELVLIGLGAGEGDEIGPNARRLAAQRDGDRLLER